MNHLLFVRVTECTGRSKRINVWIQQFTNEFRCTVLRNVDTVRSYLLPESFRPRLKPVHAVLPVCDGIKGCHARRSHWQKSGFKEYALESEGKSRRPEAKTTVNPEVGSRKSKSKSKSKYRYVGKIVWDITPTLR